MAIKHSVTVVSGQRGEAVHWNANHVIDSDVDVAKFQLLNTRIENRTTWPAGPAVGQVIYRTDLGEAYVWSGTDWQILTLKPYVDGILSSAKLVKCGLGNFMAAPNSSSAWSWGHGEATAPDYVFATPIVINGVGRFYISKVTVGIYAITDTHVIYYVTNHGPNEVDQAVQFLAIWY